MWHRCTYPERPYWLILDTQKACTKEVGLGGGVDDGEEEGRGVAITDQKCSHTIFFVCNTQ